MLNTKTIKIAGAGISGLTAAINLAKAGFKVEVFERADDTGVRFQGDFQGIENWSSKQDVLEFLKEINIKPTFNYKPVTEITFWGPNDFKENLKLSRPGFYLVKRGKEKGTLDYSLKEQALTFSNLKIFYNHPVQPEEVDIVASGPVFNDPQIDAFDAGITFETQASDCSIAILDDNLALDGYSYFFIWSNQGVIATCIFGDFQKLNKYRDKTIEFCKKIKQFNIQNIKYFTGSGNFFLPKIPKDRKIYIGEAGGFQDFLWGFGMRYAMLTGHYAALSIIQNKDFYQMIKTDILPKMETSVVNRFLFKILGNKSYKWFIKLLKKVGVEKILIRYYNPSFLKKILFPLAKFYHRKNIRDPRKMK